MSRRPEDAVARMTSMRSTCSSSAAGVGAGCALDAVTRGLTTVLVEARDWPAVPPAGRASSSTAGCGTWRCSTSAWSGSPDRAGLLLDRIAPHLVRPVPFLYPLATPLGTRLRGRRGGLYDAMAFTSGTAHGLHHHRHLTRKKACGRRVLRLRAYRPGGSTGPREVDDARHTLTVVRPPLLRPLVPTGCQVTGSCAGRA